MSIPPPERYKGEDAAVALRHDVVLIVREEIGLNESFAIMVADAIVRGLQKLCGGGELYIPAPNKSERDAAIRREFNGKNLREVCNRYGVSKTRLYEIVGRK